MNDQEQQTKPGVGASVSTAELAISPSVTNAYGLAISPSVTNAYGLYINMPSREELRKAHSWSATNRVSELAIDFGDEVFFLGFDDFIALLKASNAEREERANAELAGAAHHEQEPKT